VFEARHGKSPYQFPFQEKQNSAICALQENDVGHPGGEIVRQCGKVWQTGAAMMMELWERLRGYDKWIEVDAKISSSEVQKTSHMDRAGNVYYTYGSGDEITWMDSSGQEHSADFNVSDDSPLYQLVGGEKVTIRYNPSNPDEYHYPELLRARFVAAGRKMLVALGALILFAYVIFIRILAH
jgi:hypothetical protein